VGREFGSTTRMSLAVDATSAISTGWVIPAAKKSPRSTSTGGNLSYTQSQHGKRVSEI
jgi:hypothetical protein